MQSEEEEYELVVDFKIDDGQLDDMERNEVFVLGVEYGRFNSNLKPGFPFQMDVSERNLERVQAVLKFYMRDCIINNIPECDGIVSVHVMGAA